MANSYSKHGIIALALIAAWAFSLPNLMGQAPSSFRPAPEKAKYQITLMSVSPLRFHVRAEIPVDGDKLDMDDTYPAELPEMAAKGWPALISNLSVRDAAGEVVAVTAAGDKGWRLSAATRARLSITYDVDHSLFAANSWPSPLESAFADSDNALVACRSLFITTPKIGAADVDIVTPKGWSPVAPWTARKGTARYRVGSRRDLVDNMLVFSKNAPDVVSASGFKIQIVSMGHWRPLRPLLRDTLKTIISREVYLMRHERTEVYNVVLLPIADEGGNAFRQSFVYCYKSPDQNNKSAWANTLAHEIFHYWNYARLQGADYASSQWFQEGFTEYVANLVTVTGNIVDAAAFVEKLSRHVNNYRRLRTTLENYGTQKGPPLYSAGALVAFMWDVKIRQASAGKRNIGDLFRNLMAQTDSGARKYTWTDIRAALQATADGDWEGFYQAHIRGNQPLPLDKVLAVAGLRIDKRDDGSEQVSPDSGASKEAKALWQALIGS